MRPESLHPTKPPNISVKTLVLSLTAIFACAVPLRAGTSAPDSTNHPRADEIVQQMRGSDMQFQNPVRDDGTINPREQHRQAIVEQFQSLGKEAIPALIHALKDSDIQMRRNAVLVMISLAGGYGQPKMDIREAVPALIKATEDQDSDVRAWAAAALAEVGPDAKDAVPALTKLLDDPDEGPRNDACLALGDIGPAASGALPSLKKALNDPCKDVRQFAERAIMKIQGTHPQSILAVHDSDLPAVLRQCHAEIHSLMMHYDLASYPEHIMEQGSVSENTYRYDLGTRWLFVRVRNADGHIVDISFVQKTPK